MNNLKYWTPVVLWMVVIFIMSSDTLSSENTSLIIEPLLRFLFGPLPPPAIDFIHALIRKLAHLTEYFILGMLLFRALRRGSKELKILRWTSFSLAIVLAYAMSDEFHQSFVATRTASALDVCIDTLGGLLAQAVCAFRYRGL